MGICASNTLRVTTADSLSSFHPPHLSTKSSKSRKKSDSNYRAQLADDLFNPSKRRPSTLHLDNILTNEELRQSFCTYIKTTKEFASHRKVDFWLDSVKYEMLPYGKNERRSVQSLDWNIFSLLVPICIYY